MNLPLQFHSTPSLRLLALKAAKAWNKALRRDVLTEAASWTVCDVEIVFGPVDRRTQPNRVAEYERFKHFAFIRLASDVKWRITRWQRWLGNGEEDAYAALLHEFGHALGLPHSATFSHVMHPDLGSTVISDDEAAGYRRFLENA